MKEPLGKVEVRLDQCARIADLLSQIHVPVPEEDSPLGFLDETQLPNFYLSIVAICHQTSPMGQVRVEGRTREGQFLFGWDYLRRRWADRVSENPQLNHPAAWSTLEAADIEHLLRDEAGISTISDAIGRGALLRDLGDSMTRTGFGDARQIFDFSEGRIISIRPLGLFSQLEKIRAFSDPIRKKSCFFLELMRGQCGWIYQDPENLGAPVDYHEVRGHLRLGTIQISDPCLRAKVRAAQQVTIGEDVAIRSAVYKAIEAISRLLVSIDQPTLHYFFWNFFRQCCGRQDPHCDGCSSSCGLPSRYRLAIKPLSLSGCPFQAVCPSAAQMNKLTEHLHTTDYY
jgi:hypothetical protein